MARKGAELRKQDFIEATVKVIAEHGVANATTRRIAAEAGCALTTLHYVFHTKDDLFYAVYESLVGLPQQSLEHLPAGSSASETAAQMFRGAITEITTRPNWAKAQIDLFLWVTRTKPELARKIYSLAIDTIREAFERAIGEHVDKAFLNDLSRLLIQLADGLLISWCAHGDLERLKAETETACKALSLLVASEALKN